MSGKVEPVGPKRRLTADNLQSDAKIVAMDIVSAWEGEVDVLVVIVPRGGVESVYATSITQRERLQQVLRRVKERSAQMVDLVAKG